MTNRQQRRVYTSEEDFEDCTLTNMDTTGIPNQIQIRWILVEDWSTGIRNGTGWTWGFPANASTQAGDGGTVLKWVGANYCRTPSTYVTGTWNWRIIGVNTTFSYFAFMSIDAFTQFSAQNNYAVRVLPYLNIIALQVTSGGVTTTLGSAAIPNDASYHDVRVTRDANGEMNVYFDGSLVIGPIVNTTHTTSNYAGFTILQATFDGFMSKLYYSYAILPGSIPVSTMMPYIESDVIDQSTDLLSEQLFQSYFVEPISSLVVFQTRTSPDGFTWDAWLDVTPGTLIPSTTQRYIQWNATVDDFAGMNYLFQFVLARIYDVEVNWLTGSGRAKYPTTTSKYITDTSTLLDISQDYTDELAGDTAVYNNISVQAQPLILVGDPVGFPDENIQWQATIGTPPTAVSVSSPYPITIGTTYTFRIIPDSPVDTSRMSGASPACIAITFGGGGAGTYSFSYISPTEPVLVLVCTANGTLTNLQLIEAHFENNQTIVQQKASDATSISAYGSRNYDIANEFIVNPDFALSIAAYYLRQFKDPKSYISNCVIRPTYSLQIGDRVNIVEGNSNLHNDYIVIGIKNAYSLSTIQTGLTLLGVTV